MVEEGNTLLHYLKPPYSLCLSTAVKIVVAVPIHVIVYMLIILDCHVRM